MFVTTPFYYKLIRKYVILFGTLFNQIILVRRHKDTGIEIERVKIPILYGPKEKYITRLTSDPNLERETQITLPRMSFEITGFNYDASRKQNSLLRVAKGDTASRVSSQYMNVPWDIQFELNIYTRYVDDGTQIIEQILPYFNPDYTVSINPVNELGFIKDIPVILNSVSNSISYEGNFNSIRVINWTLTFTMKGYFYGPITTPKIIRKSIANIFNDPTLKAGYIVRMNMANGNNGVYKIEDTVYQGESISKANAFGTVLTWNPTEGKLMVGGAQGQFKVNNFVRGVSTNAAYEIISFEVSPLKLAKITVEPDPITAEPEDDYGFTTTIEEFPDITSDEDE